MRRAKCWRDYCSSLAGTWTSNTATELVIDVLRPKPACTSREAAILAEAARLISEHLDGDPACGTE
jgi:hypothetical protein